MTGGARDIRLAAMVHAVVEVSPSFQCVHSYRKAIHVVGKYQDLVKKHHDNFKPFIIRDECLGVEQNDHDKHKERHWLCRKSTVVPKASIVFFHVF